MNRTDRSLEQGQALVRAIEALETIEPLAPVQTRMVRLLLAGDIAIRRPSRTNALGRLFAASEGRA